MKDITVLTPEFFNLWNEVDAETSTWNAYSAAMRGYELVAARVLYDMGYDAHVEHIDDSSTEAYERVGPDTHDPLPQSEVDRIERALQTITLEAVLMD